MKNKKIIYRMGGSEYFTKAKALGSHTIYTTLPPCCDKCRLVDLLIFTLFGFIYTMLKQQKTKHNQIS